MKIIETVDCPLCDGKISVIVEDNKITSHGLCPKCDRPFAPDHLNFAPGCKVEELLFDIEMEVADFNKQLRTKGVA
jgi:hypothetical protein